MEHRRAPGGISGAGALALVCALMAGIAGLDFWDGPRLSAGVLFVLPVLVAGWQLGWQYGAASGLACALLRDVVDWATHSAQVSPVELLANLGYHVGTYLLVGTVTGVLGRQQRIVREQHQELGVLTSRLAAELTAARAMQELLMRPLPDLSGAEVGRYMRPARTLGGDAVELSVQGDVLAVVVADVAGKGAAAALAGAVLIGLLDDARTRFTSPAATLRTVNRRLAQRLPEEMFVTVSYALLNLRDGTLIYARAGHEPPLLLRRSGEMETLAPAGTALGIDPDARYEELRLELDPGDLLVCYTDGVTELRDGAGMSLEEAGFARVAAGHRERPAGEFVDAIAEELLAATPEPADDIAIVAVRLVASESAQSPSQPLTPA